MNMKMIHLLISTMVLFTVKGQSLIGAWEYVSKDNVRSVVIFSEGYQVIAQYDASSGAFIGTNGGSWSLTNDQMTEVIEFDSQNPDRVGSSVSFQIVQTDTTIQIVGSDNVFKRVDDGSPGELSGSWQISGRKRDGEIRKRDTNRPRKTMKMLSGKRFQWIAYNTKTKEFLGTGGGTYTTSNGKYAESIEFFSRDDTRVGATLEFMFSLQEGDWHHSGLSSKGSPIYEMWSIRK